MSVWTQDGLMIVDEQGRAIDCPTCPCGQSCCGLSLPNTIHAYWRVAGESGSPNPDEYAHTCMTLTWDGEKWVGTAQIRAWDGINNVYFSALSNLRLFIWCDTVLDGCYKTGLYYAYEQREGDTDTLLSGVDPLDDYGPNGLDGSPFTTWGPVDPGDPENICPVVECFNWCVGATGFASLGFQVDITGTGLGCTEQTFGGEALPNDTLTFEGTFVVDGTPTLLSCTLHYGLCDSADSFGVTNGVVWAGSVIPTCGSGSDDFRVGVVFDLDTDQWSVYIRNTIWTGASFPYSGTTDPFDHLCTAGGPDPVPFTIS